MKTKKTLAIFAMLATVMMAAMFTACSNDDNPVNNNPIPLDDEDATLVTNDQELRSAVKDGASIKLANDIDLSNSTLSIPSGTKVTINLGGFTLDRKLTQRGEGGGQVITVRKGATLHLTGGTLKGGWGGAGGALVNEGGTVTLTNVTCSNNVADDRGGGICNREGGTLTMTGGSITNNISNDKTGAKGGGGFFNEENATATLTNVTITGNEARVTGGGGICNFGTLTLNGSNITGNTAGTYGAGIWQEGTLNMQGANVISGNVVKDGLTHNVFLKGNAVITVTGSLEGSQIGITMEENTGTFTSGYKKNNIDVDPATVFTADLPEVMAISADDNNEAQLTNALPDGEIYYIERSWDDASKSVKTETKILHNGDYIELQGDEEAKLGTGHFVVKGDVKIDKIHCVEGGQHHLILCDGAKLTTKFVQVEDNNELDIYGQAKDNGRLVVESETALSHAGIGGGAGNTAGTIVIHGGNINATGCENAAAIGDGNKSNSATIAIYGGIIEAHGGDHGSGIGSGNFSDGSGDHEPIKAPGISDLQSGDGCTITIYGGTVKAYGGGEGAGIGSGENCNGADITINGGIVNAWGGESAAGIGTGYNDSDGLDNTGKVTVNGGRVYAYGGDDGAGIGGGKDANGADVTINGGYVYAKGDGNGAGIGSGCEGIWSGGRQGGKFTMTGGHVEAYGGEDAAGIGGGEDADGGTVNISGGYVYAKGSYGGAGIGGGESGDGANVTITGGTVHASAGSGDTGNRAIGPGYGSDAYGSLTVGDLMMVRAERIAAAVERHDMCWYRTDVHVELCTHPGYTADTCPYHKH